MINNGVVFDRQIFDNEKLKLQLYYQLMPVGYNCWVRVSGKNRKYTYFIIIQMRVQYTIMNQYFRENVVKLVIILLFLVLISTNTFSPEEKNTKNKTTYTKLISVTLEKPKKKIAIIVSKQQYLYINANINTKKLDDGICDDCF